MRKVNNQLLKDAREKNYVEFLEKKMKYSQSKLKRIDLAINPIKLFKI